MVIYFIRHAETEANVANIIQGQADSNLTYLGKIKAQQMSYFFSNKSINVIYSSPIKRALDTARMIKASCGLESILIKDELKEINLKPWELKRISTLDLSDSLSSYKTYKTNPSMFTPIYGESLKNVYDRIVKFYLKLKMNHDENDNIVVVTHSVVIRCLLIFLEEKTLDDIWKYELPPSSITNVKEIQGKHKLEFIGYLVEN